MMLRFFFALCLSLIALSSTLADADIESLLKKGAEGDPMSQLTLGEKYLDGEGVPKDAVKAVEWLKKAADYRPGDDTIWPWRSLAFALLGQAYETGAGMQNLAEAVKFYRESAMLNDPRGMMALSRIYSGRTYPIKDTIPNDDVEALTWVYVAANSGAPGTVNNDGIKLAIDNLESKVGDSGIALAKQKSQELAVEIAKGQ